MPWYGNILMWEHNNAGVFQTGVTTHTKVPGREVLSAFINLRKTLRLKSGNPRERHMKQRGTRRVQTMQGLVGEEFRLYSKYNVFP